MKLKEALYSDIRKEGVAEELHALLCKIPPLKKYEDSKKIPIEVLEKLLRKFEEKYDVRLQYIMPTYQKETNSHYYSCSVKTDSTHDWIGTVHGITIYECFVKLVLMCYGYSRSKRESE